MRIQTLFALFALAMFFIVPGVGSAHAQMMGGYEAGTSSDAESAAGAALSRKLSSGAASCSSLTESDFDALGNYFMGAMMGANHDAMDRLMEQSLGAAGERQMHVAMGERLSGCNLSAAYPARAGGFFPSMMGMMMGMGGFGKVMGTNGFGGMMGYGGLGSWAVVGTVLIWALALVGIVALARLLLRKL